MKIAIAARTELTYAEWGPPLAASGLPGTEEAILHMSRGLAGLGHEVAVITNCGTFAGVHDGVRWIDIERLAEPETYDIAVIVDVRLAPLFAASKRRYLWLHIDEQGDTLALALASGLVHKIMPLSQFSRRSYTAVPDEQVFVTRNGIDPSHFDRVLPRDPHRIVYGSDYDRGLMALLGGWPRLRAEFPDATLHVFYGWAVFDKKIAWFREHEPENAALWQRVRDRIEELFQQDGVTHLGRIGHQAVADEFLQAGVWAYPCVFPETSCITAMKAQAGGAVPLVIPTGALIETVRWGVRTRRSPPDCRTLDRELAQQWFEALLALLRDTDLQQRFRDDMIMPARAFFDWRTVAAEWSAEFGGG